MIRVILDTQSNRHFRGIQFEQRYDQRGGLCQTGGDGIVVTTDPFDPEYLHYWQDLGFQLPRLIAAGPFDPERTLSELVLSKSEVQTQIRSSLDGQPTRLEFFCIEESERLVAAALGIEPYCNFTVALTLSRKPVFKRFFDDLSVPTPAWFACRSRDDLIRCGRRLLDNHRPFVVKDEDGTGGIGCNSMFKIQSQSELDEALSSNHDFGGEFVVEEAVNRLGEVSVHWEMKESVPARIIGIFDQLSKNYGYAGAAWPSAMSNHIQSAIIADLRDKIIPALKGLGGLGFFCCDILVDALGRPYWIDLNPRKGAILYVYDMVRRLSEIHFNGEFPCFVHEHLRLSPRAEPCTFKEVRELLSDSLIPSRQQPFIMVSNSGVIPFGYLDITSVSYQSRDTASELLERTKEFLTY